ncbi:secretion/DNA translocation related TadE-like protein [Humibacillus xanthopallidus]|uniref:Secretion/DNA translocation related TadE-like protein n=1 Tax=Humibacillus xanthopallidus TaxID=412689 RepID=A0A543PMH0_9MICO|nr:Rv3654c family TadE-like protein [Humibacillus xanthopallidus]TQN45278.1 secretion/DNA translocation related TadE-like protein [Humibacillus xanthopallidus]
MRAAARDRGSASVIVIAVIGVIVVLSAGALMLAGAVRASHQARLGADLAAIAGAQHLRDGASAAEACAVVARMATMNGTALQACSVSGTAVSVTVVARSSSWPEPAIARARAGQQSPVP